MLDALVIITFIGSIVISTALYRIFRELKDISESLYRVSKHLENIDKKDDG